MGTRIQLTEQEKRSIRKQYLNEDQPELEVFPIDGPYNIGYDKDWDDFYNPIGTANSDFSKRPTGHGAGGHPKGHFGIDIFGPKGTDIVAPVKGEVKLNFGNGNTVIIKDLNGYSHWLGHLDSISVSDGELVEAGTKVGTLGNTGNARGTSPHLHYNVYPTASGFYSAEDPIDILTAAIGKTPSGVKSDPLQWLSADRMSKGLKDYISGIFGKSDSKKEELAKKMPETAKASTAEDIFKIIKQKGGEYVDYLKNLFA